MRIHSVQRTSVLAVSLKSQKVAFRFPNVYIQSHLSSAIVGWNGIVHYKRRAPRVPLDTAPLDNKSPENISSLDTICLSFSFPITNRRREKLGTRLEYCTAHKHTKLKRSDYPDPISFIYLIQSLCVSLHATLFTFCQKYPMYKGRVCAYKKNVRFHKMRTWSFVSPS